MFILPSALYLHGPASAQRTKDDGLGLGFTSLAAHTREGAGGGVCVAWLVLLVGCLILIGSTAVTLVQAAAASPHLVEAASSPNLTSLVEAAASASASSYDAEPAAAFTGYDYEAPVR
jgi:hypothetical protein